MHTPGSPHSFLAGLGSFFFSRSSTTRRVCNVARSTYPYRESQIFSSFQFQLRRFAFLPVWGDRENSLCGRCAAPEQHARYTPPSRHYCTLRELISAILILLTSLTHKSQLRTFLFLFLFLFFMKNIHYPRLPSYALPSPFSSILSFFTVSLHKDCIHIFLRYIMHRYHALPSSSFSLSFLRFLR